MRSIFIDPRDIRNTGLYILAIAVLPLAWIIVALFIWRDDYTDFILYFAGAMALAGAVFVYWKFDRIPPGPNEAELKKKMTEMMAKGEILAIETTEPLTPEESRWLTRLNNILVGVLIIVMGGIAFVTYYPAKEMAGDPWSIVIPAGIGLLFSFLVYKYALMLPKIVKAGKKEVVNGIVTNRLRRIEYRHVYYYLTVGTKELRVGKRDYRTYQVGEAVRITFLPDFGSMVMKITRMNGEG